MIDLKPYFCSECGKTHIYKELNKNWNNRRCCTRCEGTRICLSGWALLMIAGTLGLVYILPNIISYQLGTSSEFRLGLIKGDPYVLLPTIVLLAMVSVLRILEMKLRQKKPLRIRKKSLDLKKPQSSRRPRPDAQRDNSSQESIFINSRDNSAKLIKSLWAISELPEEQQNKIIDKMERLNKLK